MDDNNIKKDIELIIDGMGLVLYSDEAMKDVRDGENFFNKEFSTPEKVASHIAKGDIVGFNTGTGGKFIIKFRKGYPSSEMDKKYPISIRLAIDIKGNKLSIIDLYWLMEWSEICPKEQQIDVEKGIYHLTIVTTKPQSGIWGDNQEIYIYMKRLDEMPKLMWKGVPCLFN